MNLTIQDTTEQKSSSYYPEVITIDILSISCEIPIGWLPQDLIDD